MAKGFEKNKFREQELKAFGKNLARRAKSKCELCEAKSAPLNIYELEPKSEKPEFENCILICDQCKVELKNLDKLKPDYWRFITKQVWSEIFAVKVLSLRIARLLSKKHTWANDILEQTYTDEDLLHWLNDE